MDNTKETKNDSSDNKNNTESSNAINTAKVEMTTNDSNLEERYIKLKGLAVKLKKKVSDLSEQNLLLEAENKKIKNEAQELQSKISGMSDNAKKLQTVQVQYDQLLDDIEKIKDGNKKLVKKLENIILENDSLKDSLLNEKQTTNQQNIRINELMQEKLKLEQVNDQVEKKLKELNSELRAETLIRQEKFKECEDLRNSLDAETKAHKLCQIRLGDLRNECTSNNVLSLEVANYEKSIDSINLKLEEKANKQTQLEALLNEQAEIIKNLTLKNSELEDSCLSKSNGLTTFEEKNHLITETLNKTKLELSDCQKQKENLSNEVKRLETIKKDLETKIILLSSEISKIEEENKTCIKTYQSHVDDLKRETSRLNLALENSRRETNTLQEEFENYKLRAQSVLLKTKNVSVSNNMEEEIEHFKRENSTLREKIENYKDRIESMNREIILLKDERTRASTVEDELLKKLKLMQQDSSNLMERYKQLESEMQKLQISHETTINSLRNKNEEEIAIMKKNYEEEISSLKQEILAQTSESIQTNNLTHVSPTKIINSPPLNEREECEGSENTEFFQNINKHTEQNKEKSSKLETSVPLTPLDQLLEYSFENNEASNTIMPENPEIQAYKSRVKHLTELLADAEKDVEKLTQLNHLLKEDIRLQKRFVKREEEAVNFEYLKNVVFKFVTLENRDERRRLVPVLDTILKLSPDETNKLNEIASNTATGGVLNTSWIPGWNSNF